MKRLLLILTLLVCLSVGLSGVVHAQGQLSKDDINRIARSVVYIGITSGGQMIGNGSGTIISSDGLIFTNAHVALAGDDFMIFMVDDLREQPLLRYFASPIYIDDEIDFAVLAIDRDAMGRTLDPEALSLPFIDFAQSDPELGDYIYVFGYPGIGDAFLVLTQGTITTIQNGTVAGQRLAVNYQTDAEISPGSSGGLVVDNDGLFVGIPSRVDVEGQTLGRLGSVLPLPAISAVMSTIDTKPDVVQVPTPTPITKPGGKPQPTPQTQQLYVEITNVEHGVPVPNATPQQKTDLGMLVHTYIRATGYQNMNLRVALFFFWENGTLVSGANAPIENQTASEAGLTLQAVITPQYADTEWTDYWFWMPYTHFPTMKTGSYPGYVEVQIGVDGQEFINWSNQVTFNYNVD